MHSARAVGTDQACDSICSVVSIKENGIDLSEDKEVLKEKTVLGLEVFVKYREANGKRSINLACHKEMESRLVEHI